MSNEWTLVCKVDADYVDIASVFLFDAGATAISETHGDYRIELRAGFLDEDTAQAAVVDLAQRLPDTPCVAFLDTRQDEWIKLQREGLSPTTIGPWTIRAPWHRAQTSASDTEIVIDPGAAFGHGAHHSTRLAADLMLRSVTSADTVVDLGTGTGVLAILAAKLGATVRAVEVDPVAIEVASENIERNGVGDLIELTCRDAAVTPIAATDVVIANVTLDIHRLIASNYQAAERILVAGILCKQVAPLCDLLDGHQAKTIRTNQDWAAIDLRSVLTSQNEPKTAE